MKRLILGAAFGCFMSVANARDLGQWQSVNPEVRELVSSPEAARQSCYFMLWRSRRLLVGFI
jgi:hypothetical protein